MDELNRKASEGSLTLGRRTFVRAVLSGAAMLAAGCGTETAFDAPSGNPGGGGGGGAAGPPVVIPKVGVGAINGPDLDPGIAATAHIVASLGATIPLPDGGSLVIPPGAAPADFDLTVTIPTGQKTASPFLTYLLEPQGMKFNLPVTLNIPVGDVQANQILQAFVSSTLNPILDLGSEKTNWTLPEAASLGGGFLSIQLSHFTAIFILATGAVATYLVLDIPAELLDAGDLAFFLTQQEINQQAFGSQWAPGHVACFLGRKGGDIVEADGTAVLRNHLSFTKHHPVEHIYLGPRRASRTGSPRLSDAQQQKVIDFLQAALDNKAGYSLVGDTILGDAERLADKLWGGKGSPLYSCASLVEGALRAGGHGLATPLDHAFILTPLELYIFSSPIRQVEIPAGVKFTLPIYGVVLKNESTFFANILNGGYTRDQSYTVVATSDLPPGATFSATTVEGHPGYIFVWTPTPDQVDKTFDLAFTLTADRIPSIVNPAILLTESTSHSLTLKVTPGGPQFDITLLGLANSGTVGQADVNTAGHMVYVGAAPGTSTLTTFLHTDSSSPDTVVFPGFSDRVAINDQDHVAYGAGSKVFLWTDTLNPPTDLGDLGGFVPFPSSLPDTRLGGLNNADVIVGWSTPAGAQKGPASDYGVFEWANGQMIEIPGTRSGGFSSLVMGFNDNLQIVASSDPPRNPDGSISSATQTTRLIDGSQVTNLTTIIAPGPDESTSAINNAQQVTYSRQDGLLFSPILWDKTNGPTRLPSIDGTAQDLNSQGWVVGNARLVDNGPSVGVLWKDGQAFDLNAGLPPGSPTVTQAIAIGDRGHIAAVVQDDTLGTRWALLTPNPPLVT